MGLVDQQAAPLSQEPGPEETAPQAQDSPSATRPPLSASKSLAYRVPTQVSSVHTCCVGWQTSPAAVLQCASNVHGTHWLAVPSSRQWSVPQGEQSGPQESSETQSAQEPATQC